LVDDIAEKRSHLLAMMLQFRGLTVAFVHCV